MYGTRWHDGWSIFLDFDSISNLGCFPLASGEVNNNVPQGFSLRLVNGHHKPGLNGHLFPVFRAPSMGRAVLKS